MDRVAAINSAALSGGIQFPALNYESLRYSNAIYLSNCCVRSMFRFEGYVMCFDTRPSSTIAGDSSRKSQTTNRIAEENSKIESEKMSAEMKKLFYNTTLSQTLSTCGDYLFAGNNFGEVFVFW